MKRLNYRFLAIALVLFVAIGAIIFAFHRFQIGRQSVFFGEQAEAALQSERFDEAIRLYQLSLQMKPQDPDLRLGVAEAYERTNQYQNAYSASQRAEQVAPENRENQIRLVRTGLVMGRYGDSIARLQPLIETAGQSFPVESSLPPLEGATRSQLYEMLGRARLGNREPAAAIEAFEQSIDAGGASIDAYARLAALFDEESRDADAADKAMELLIQEYGHDPKAWIVRGRRWLKQNQMDRAQSDADRALALAEDSGAIDGVTTDVSDADTDAAMDSFVGAIEFASDVAVARNNFDRSIDLLTVGMNAYPNHPPFYRLAHATLLKQQENTSDASEREDFSHRALAILQSGIARLPSDPSLLWTLAADHLENERLNEARQVTDQLRQLSFDASLVNYLDARWMAATGDVHSAALRMEKVRSDVIQQPALVRLVDLTLAGLYEKMGDYDRQIAVLRRVVGQDSLWLPARERLALAFLRVGRIDDAVAEYRIVTDRPGVPIRAPLVFARLLLMQNLGRDPSARDWSQMISILDQLSSEPSLLIDVTMLRAEMFAANSEVDRARELLADVIGTDGDDDRLWSARISLEVSQRNFDQANRWIVAAGEKFGDSPAIRYATASALVSQNADDADEKLAQLTVMPDDWTDDQKFELSASIVPLLISAARYDDADRLATLAARLRPDEVSTRLQLIQVAFQARRPDRLREHLSALELVVGKDARWYYGNALAISLEATADESLVDPRKSDGSTRDDLARDPGSVLTALSAEQNRRAQESLAEAAVLRPDWNLIPAFSAYLYDQAQDDAAINKYGEAVELGWRNPASIRRLIQLLTQRERFGEADSVIRRLRSGSEPFTSEMSRIASEISAEMADLRRAVSLADEAARQSGSVEDYLWLGQLSEMVEDDDAAEKAYRAAITASDSESGDRVASATSRPTLAWIGYLKRNARLGEAKSALEDLEASIGESGDDATRLLLADGYARIDAIDQAARVLQSVSTESLSGLDQFRQYYQIVLAARGTEEATDRLRYWLELRSGDKGLAPEVIAWVRRTLALSLAGTGDPSFYAEAKSLLGQNLKANQATTGSSGTLAKTEVQLARMEDRRAAAIIDAIYVGGNQPSEALSQFNSLIDDGWQPTIEDQFVIGQLSAADGDWAQGRRLMLPLLSSNELRKPTHVTRYIRLLLANNDAAEASLWIDRLQQSGIRDAETARLTADVLRRRGNHDRLLQLLTTRADEAGTADEEVQWFTSILSTTERFELLTELMTDLVQETADDPAVSKYRAASESMAASLTDAGEFPGSFFAAQMLRRGDCEAAVTTIDRVADQLTETELVDFAEQALVTTDCGSLHGRLANIYQGIGKRLNDSLVYAIIVARLREAQGDYDSAIEVYRSILQREPDHFAAGNNLATLLALSGREPKLAIQIIDDVIEKNGETLVTLDTRGVCHLADGQIAQAVADFESALVQFPHPVVQFHLAQLALMTGELKEAERRFAIARRAGLKRVDVHTLEHGTFDKLSSL